MLLNVDRMNNHLNENLHCQMLQEWMKLGMTKRDDLSLWEHKIEAKVYLNSPVCSKSYDNEFSNLFVFVESGTLVPLFSIRTLEVFFLAISNFVEFPFFLKSKYGENTLTPRSIFTRRLVLSVL